MRVLWPAGVVSSQAAPEPMGVVHVEVIESPQGGWWVVADGHVVRLYLATEQCPDPYLAALNHGEQLSKPHGLSILTIGTTWRSMAFRPYGRAELPPRERAVDTGPRAASNSEMQNGCHECVSLA